MRYLSLIRYDVTVACECIGFGDERQLWLNEGELLLWEDER